MQCYTNEEALASLFINLSTSSFLLLLLLYSAASLLLKFFHFIGGYPLLQRNEDEYDSAPWYSEDEEEEEETEQKMSCDTSYHVISRYQNPDHLIADIGEDGESLVFYNNNSQGGLNNQHKKEFINVNHQSQEHEEDDQDSNSCSTDEHFSSANDSPNYCSESSIEDDGGVEDLHEDRYDNDDDDEEEIGGVSRYDVVEDLLRKRPNTTTRGPSRLQSGLVFNDKTYNGEILSNARMKNVDVEIQPSSEFGMREIKAEEEEEEEEEERGEIFGESCTNESTSKSSSEWRNSVKTDDPFSSSSRRSCPKWESYTVYQKYDEEMTFLTRISAQNLHETESLKSILVQPRSISERIVHKLSSNGHKRKQQQHTSSNGSRPNPYMELESAYVAQICLTWEALSWNYKNFERKRFSSTQQSFNDVGCPAGIADQFRTFHILLQRYIENEPYEHGRRPQIYARMRTLAPKLLLVPEYQDYEEEEEEEGFKTRITSASFLMIMEECIRTFMNFLKADKEKPCQKIIKAFFGRSKRGSVDPTLVHLMKKVNTKKKSKLKEMRRGGKYMRKKKMSIEEEMEILMGLIDLKVVSRVLRMSDLNEEKLHWCEEKMSKVKIIQDGKGFQRDSTPLFFPPH